MKMKMKSIVLCVLAVITLSGCASKGQRGVQQSQIDSTIPFCTSKKQCDAAWSASRDWVNRNCGMKIQNYNESYIETYNSPNYSTNIACQVSKNPLPSGATAISMFVNCSNFLGCQPDQYEAVISFNKYVSDYIKKFAPKPIGVIFEMYGQSNQPVQTASESIGLHINSMTSDGIARKSGLLEKDIITEINGNKIRTLSDYAEVAERHGAGDNLNVKILRNNNPMEISILL